MPRPAPDQVRAIIARDVPGACPSDLRVRRVRDIGGPGLPAGMHRFHSIECDVPGMPAEEDPRVAVVYKFATPEAAFRWIESFDAEDDESYGWWLNGSTLLANVNLSEAAWKRVTAALDRDHEGRRVGHRDR